MRVSSNEYNPTFNAQLISQWKCHNAKGNLRNVSIVALEKRDAGFIKNFRENLDKFNHLTPIRQAIIDASTSTIDDVLQDTRDIFQRVKMYMAIYDGKPCGFLVANVPKKQPGTGVEVYTSRHNPAKNETEIDWLVTWNPNRNENLRSVGKALVGEYFRTVKADKFRDVFVRSEIPEHSYAYYFYESIGFERLGEKRAKLFNKNNAKHVVTFESDPEDRIIPMIVTRRVLQQKSEELARNMSRKEFVKNSTDIEELVEQ